MSSGVVEGEFGSGWGDWGLGSWSGEEELPGVYNFEMQGTYNANFRWAAAAYDDLSPKLAGTVGRIIEARARIDAQKEEMETFGGDRTDSQISDWKTQLFGDESPQVSLHTATVELVECRQLIHLLKRSIADLETFPTEIGFRRKEKYYAAFSVLYPQYRGIQQGQLHILRAELRQANAWEREIQSALTETEAVFVETRDRLNQNRGKEITYSDTASKTIEAASTYLWGAAEEGTSEPVDPTPFRTYLASIEQGTVTWDGTLVGSHERLALSGDGPSSRLKRAADDTIPTFEGVCTERSPTSQSVAYVTSVRALGERAEYTRPSIDAAIQALDIVRGNLERTQAVFHQARTDASLPEDDLASYVARMRVASQEAETTIRQLHHEDGRIILGRLTHFEEDASLSSGVGGRVSAHGRVPLLGMVGGLSHLPSEEGEEEGEQEGSEGGSVAPRVAAFSATKAPILEIKELRDEFDRLEKEGRLTDPTDHELALLRRMDPKFSGYVGIIRDLIRNVWTKDDDYHRSMSRTWAMRGEALSMLNQRYEVRAAHEQIKALLGKIGEERSRITELCGGGRGE